MPTHDDVPLPPGTACSRCTLLEDYLHALEACEAAPSVPLPVQQAPAEVPCSDCATLDQRAALLRVRVDRLALQSLSRLERLAFLAVGLHGEEGAPKDVRDHAARVRRALASKVETPR
jgi:hypothetical protein